MPPTYRHYFELVRYKASIDLKSEGSQSYLGVIWWVLDPLLYLIAFYLIFEVFMQRGGEGFVGFLLCGLVFWRWFDSCVKQAADSIQGRASIIGQVYVPKLLFPVTDMLIASYRFFFVCALLFIFMAFYSGVSLSWLALPIVMLTQALLIMAIGLAVALCVPFFPDVRKLLDNGMMLLFYMSGIFFDISLLEGQAGQLLSFNPIAALLLEYRSVLLVGAWPDWSVIISIAGGSLVFVLCMLIVGVKLDLVLPRIVRS